MKEYPSIDGSKFVPIGEHCYVQKKHDGSNLRCRWSRKKGWHQWGTRTRLFDHTDPEFAPAIKLFEAKYAESLAKAIVDCPDFKKPDEAMAFMEFFGPHSFSGWHDPKALRNIGINVETNDPKDVVVFDVNIHKRGFVGPRNFAKVFGHLPVVELLYSGILTEEYVQDVRDGKVVDGEGVVVKWGDGHQLKMCKIKTSKYIQELKDRFGVGWTKYGE